MKFRRLSWVEHVVTRSLTLREESRLRAFENKILGRNLGLSGMRMWRGEGSTIRNYIVCTVELIISG